MQSWRAGLAPCTCFAESAAAVNFRPPPGSDHLAPSPPNMMQVTLPHSVCPRGCRLPARGQRHAARPVASAADTAESASAGAAAAEGVVYDGVFPKPLGVKFARGADGGAYVISKSAEEAYAQFEVGDKILEVRRVEPQRCAQPRSGGLALARRRGASRRGAAGGVQVEVVGCSGRQPPVAHTARPPPCSPARPSVRRCGRLRTTDRVRLNAGGRGTGRVPSNYCPGRARVAPQHHGLCADAVSFTSHVCHQNPVRRRVLEDVGAQRCVQPRAGWWRGACCGPPASQPH